MIYRFRVDVRKKDEVFDPEAETVKRALVNLGFDKVKELRIGRFFELSVEAENEAKAKEMVDEIAKGVLANPIIEEFETKI
jgi:phosphoribosylformylglycinamidine synthase